jgi:uncharacterized membrane protein YfcA
VSERRRFAADAVLHLMPDIDPLLSLAGLLVGFTVGLTGMGGGALMTPLLILVFGVAPLTAVSSDLVVSLILKPVGSAVHMRRGTVNRGLVRWLVVGSVPSAFAGVLVLRALGDGERVQSVVKLMLGIALLMASTAIVVKAYLQLRAKAADRAARAAGRGRAVIAPLRVRPVPTLLIGALGGFIVGMTSVGSGSLIIVLLLLLYPTIKASEVVGTDLVQAVPLVAAAALGHLFFGEVELGLTASLVIGGVPGVYLGARLSSRAPQGIIRRALVLVLVASGLKLIGASNEMAAWLLVALVLLGPAVWAWARHGAGLPWLWSVEKRRSTHQALFFESLAQAEDDGAGAAGSSGSASSAGLERPK